jgi:hypothetical protein
MEVKTSEEKLVVNTDYVEAGELANEIGKIYMKKLDDAIQDGKELGLDKVYFIIQTEKDPSNLSHIEIRIGITDKYFEKMFESTDFWEYDYRTNKKSILWTVPSRIDMKNFLRSPEKYSKDLIKWIKIYLAQNPDINLHDKRSLILS